MTMQIKNMRIEQYEVSDKPRLVKALSVCFLGLFLNACAGEDQLPNGATLSISPQERTLNVSSQIDPNGNCLIDPENTIDWPIVLQLSDSAGSPIGDSTISVYTEFGENTFSGFPVMELYDDVNGNRNGLVDEDELISGADDDIARVDTSEFGGHRELLLRVNISCPFRGEVFAFIQGVTASSTLVITTDQSDL